MGKSNTTWFKLIAIQPDLKAYDVRLTRGWAEAIGEASSRSPQLSEITCDLVTAMRYVEATARLPYVVITQLHGFIDGYMRANSEPVAQRTAKHVTEKLTNELIIGDPVLRTQIAAKCLELSAEAHKRVIPPSISLESLWIEYRKLTHFQFGLVGSQQICFVAAYNAYDDLLMRCFRIAFGDANYRKGSDKDFARDFEKAFDAALLHSCWGDSEMQLFRAARHSFAHVGGRVTKELQALNHPFQVEQGVIQFGPYHTDRAFRLVEHGADALVASAAKHPNFQ